jgi:hypothetical protein
LLAAKVRDKFLVEIDTAEEAAQPRELSARARDQAATCTCRMLHVLPGHLIKRCGPRQRRCMLGRIADSYALKKAANNEVLHSLNAPPSQAKTRL